MRIQPISNFNTKLTFKRNDYFDDLENENVVHSFTQYSDYETLIRERMRRNILGRCMPLENTINPALYGMTRNIEDLNIRNLQKIDSNCYRGSLFPAHENCFKILKQTGISTIIDLSGNNYLKESCGKNNINYYGYNIPENYWGNPIFKTNEELLESKEIEWKNQSLTEAEKDLEKTSFLNDINNQRNNYIADFKKLIDVINGKSFYICCEEGEYRTPNILALNTFFNPRWSGRKIYPTNDFIYTKIINMFKNLTQEHKDILGIKDKYYLETQEFLKKVNKTLLHRK